MNLFTGVASDEFFGGPVPDAARRLMHEAGQAPREAVGALLWTAQALAPQSLAIYYVLYKHHAGRREFDQAEAAAARALREAALQCGLPPDWREVTPQRVPAGLDFGRNGPARFWLFTLKAQAFIALRSERIESAREMLALLGSLDATAGVGDDVVAALLASVSPPPAR